jgi:M6 family metalloprotease-like protein
MTIIVVCLIAAVHLPVQAAPNHGEVVTFHQKDGSKLDLKGFGDEFYMRFETQDGYTVVHDKKLGAFCYAVLSNDGNQLVSTGIPVGQAKPADLATHITVRTSAEKQIRSNLRDKWTSQMDCVKRWDTIKAASRQNSALLASPSEQQIIGELVGLTVLVDFPDDPGTITQQEVSDFCNKVGYNKNGNNGSVYDYFLENSNNLLKYTNIVVGYYRAKKSKSYYNKRESNFLVEEVAEYLKKNPPKDLAKLSTYPDGNIRAFNLYYAGDSPESDDDGLWPHAHVIDSVDIGAGKKIRDYQMTNMGDFLKLGVFCHESGHLLCSYPDIYDGSFKSVGGAGYFCLMDSAGSGIKPSQICAYLKYKSGWGTVTVISGSTPTTGNEIHKSGTGSEENVGNQFYLYPRPGVPTEYYLIENRQKLGHDIDIPAAGIAIWHVDELGYRNYSNYQYNTKHNNYEVTLMQADNLWHFEKNGNAGDAQDLFYHGNQAAEYTNAFTDTSSPSSKWWDGTTSQLSITSISDSGDTMTFDAAGANTHSIKGKISGSVAGGVTVSLTPTTESGDINLFAPAVTPNITTTETALDGTYAFKDLAKGTYIITPSYSGVTFQPPRLDVTVDEEEEDDEDFESSGEDSGSIVVTSPVGGEELEIGAYHTIRWNSIKVPGAVVIEALKNGTLFRTIDANAENTESYEWNVDRSYTGGSDYQIRISSLDNPSVSWTSDKFNLSYPVMRATTGSTLTIADTFDSKPNLYIVDATRNKKQAQVNSWMHGGTTFTWKTAVAEGRYTLFAKEWKTKARVITDNFIISKPTIDDYSNPVPMNADQTAASSGNDDRIIYVKKYFTMRLFGTTGGKPTVWWTYGKAKKLNCTVVEYLESDYTEPDPQEVLVVRFSADLFTKYSPTQLSIKNSMGTTQYQIQPSNE